LRAIYGSKFDQQFTSEQDVAESKAIWGSDIAGKTDAQLMGCISNCKARVRAGDSDWLWPNIGLVLGFVDNSWQHAASRVDFTGHAQLEDLTAKERRIAIGKSEIEKLKGLFG